MTTRPIGVRLVLIAVFTALAAVVGVAVGPSDAGLRELFQVLGGEGDATTRGVLLEIRLPTALLGLLVGAALAVSGTLLQALLRNDLAEPYLVGVGPGAYLGVTVAALLAHHAGLVPDAWLRSAFALAFAVGVSVVIFAFATRARRGGGPTLLLAGVALGAFVSAIATALLYGALPRWDQVVYWMLGHLSPPQTLELLLLLAVLLLASLAAFVRARDLDAVALGEEGAWLLGVHVRRLTLGLGFAAAALAAFAVSMAGLIGFVGLLVPHLARGLVGPGHRALIPASALLGGGLLVLADALARTLSPPLVLPVGVVTAALGAPFLAWILLRR